MASHPHTGITASTTSANPAKRRRISRILSADARGMIAKCVHYVQHCKALRGDSYSLAAEMLGVSHGSVQNVMKEFRELREEQGTSDVKFVEREDIRPKEPLVKPYHENYVQHELFSMIELEDLEELPTVSSIFQKIQENKVERARSLHVTAEEVWPFGRTTLWKVLGKLGYSYQVDTDDREGQMLQPHVVDHKLYYLRRITHLRASNAVLLYVDETWVNKNHTRTKSWILDESKAKDRPNTPEVLRRKGSKKPIGKGGRAIIIGIGSVETGTVPELLEIFKGKTSKKHPDYHSEMNAQHFEEWWGKVLQYIEVHRHEWGDRPVCIIMDNASYHSRLMDEAGGYWTVLGTDEKPCRRGAPIPNNFVIRLKHAGTGKWLHSHAEHKSPLSGNQEVSCFGDDTDTNSADFWKVETVSGKGWRREENVRFKHVDTGKYLHSTGQHQFGRPIAQQREVCTFGRANNLNVWRAMEGMFVKANTK